MLPHYIAVADPYEAIGLFVSEFMQKYELLETFIQNFDKTIPLMSFVCIILTWSTVDSKFWRL